MKHLARHFMWSLTLIALVVAAALLLTSCQYLQPSPPDTTYTVKAACPHTATWTLDEKVQLAHEDAALPEGSVLHKAVVEDGSLRAQIHANSNCKGD